MKKIKIQRKKPKVSYVGSTIMQNHSEAKYSEHGILVWDVYSKTSEFVPIHNDYGYVTVDVENGNIVGNPLIPNKPRMRLRVKDTTQSELKKLLSKIRIGRNVQEVSIQKVITDKTDYNGSSNLILQNVRDIGFQNKLIEDYLTDRYLLSNEQFEVIRNINTDINTKIGPLVGMKNVIWKPKTFEFSNMFSYGGDNIIDFSQMKGTYGIFAPNASGKSSLWDALSFCIYDKCSRTSKAIDVLNYSKSEFHCKFNFEIDGVDYFIERLGKKSPKRGTIKVDVNFYRITEDGITESLNGDERRDTNSIIRQYVGSYEDFILTAMSNQSNNSGFIEKTQKERKTLLAQFLDMDVFEELYQVASEQIKELSGLLKDYKNQNFTERLADANGSLIENRKKVGETQSLLDKYKQRRVKVGHRIENLLSELITVDSAVINTDNLLKIKENLQSQLVSKETECNGYQQSLDNFNSKLKEAQSKFGRYDLVDLKENHLKYEMYAGQLQTIQKEINELDREIDHKKTHLDGIGSLTFDNGCEHCVTNKNTPFAQQAQTLEKEIRELALIRITRSGEYDNASMGKAKHDVNDILLEVQRLKVEIDTYGGRIEKLELQNKSCNLELSELKNKIEKIEGDIKKSIEQKESVEYNTKIQIEIDKFKENLKEIEDLISDTNNYLIEVSGNARIAENIISTINDSIRKLEYMERKYEGYEYYIQCVKRDGIPYKLITDILPKLEVEINNILQPLVDFQVLLNTDGKNINSYIAYGDDEFWPLELTSGMEKFISSVAIRTALINVSNLPRPNFIAIDEGFGSLDSDNFNSLYLLFDYLKGEFDFLVTISHIDKTRDMVDHIIDITKLGGFSSIRYL
jgi:DNA repair exonuclease SbcCD ATPase subunit